MFGGLIGKLFGTEKALAGIVDGVTKGLDALVYTDQEKAHDAAAEYKEGRQMVVEWMRTTQGQNLARRLIALSITGVWLFMYVFSVCLNMVAVFANEAEKIIHVSNIAKESANDMSSPVMLILAFYFAAPHMGGIAKAAIERFGKGKIK